MRLGLKLTVGFFIPCLMLVVAGSWSVKGMHDIGREVEQMVLENHRSVDAARRMTGALEKMDNAVLMDLAGAPGESAMLIERADSLFLESLAFAEGNVTLPGEADRIDEIHRNFGAFRKCLGNIDSLGIDNYSGDCFPLFEAVWTSVDGLRRMNADAIYETSLHISEKALRATLPSRILIIASLIFTALFAWLSHVYFVRPIRQLLEVLNQRKQPSTIRTSASGTGDELDQLASKIHDLLNSKGGNGAL